MVEEIIPHRENPRSDFSKLPEDDPKAMKLVMNRLLLLI